MVENLLKMNDDKTVALMLGSRNNQGKHHIAVIKIGDCDITPSPTARNIGAVFNSEMSMVCHVKYTCCEGWGQFPRNWNESIQFQVQNPELERNWN